MNKEQRGISNEINQSVKSHAKFLNKNHSSLLIPHSSFLTSYSSFFLVLCSLLFVACDLFTGPQVDIFQQISEEVDWSHAAKLNVKVDFPSTWGVSPQQGTNRCYDNKRPNENPRKGYEFKVEFTPDTAYTLTAWLAFRTSDLPSNWLDDPTTIAAENVQSLGPGEVTLPQPVAGGGTFNFKVHTVDPVTLVPWCQTQPRVTRTEPRHRPEGNPYARATDIVIYFNGALNANTVKFADTETTNGIWITSAKDDNVKNNKDEEWYNPPEYSTAGGFFTVTMTVGTLPPEGSFMTVTVKGIKNAQGEAMDGDYSFSWNTSSAVAVSLTSYSAVYNSDNITVTYTQTNADDVKTYYRRNKGANTPFDGTISGVPAPEAGNVKNGISVSGIQEYEIVIELYAENIMEHRTTFKIWNIPGMIASLNNTTYGTMTITEITALSAIHENATGQYVLVNDITVGSHTPISNFKGKFYGNGHTVTISGSMTANNSGLFGTVSDGIVRDLTVNYSNATINPTDTAQFGGIAGTTSGSAQLINILVKGAVTFSVNGDTNAYVGGMVGRMGTATTDTTSISNAYGGLNLTVEKSNAVTSGSLYIGGAVGSMGDVTNGSVVKVREVSVTGNITVGKNGTPVNVVDNGYYNTSYGLFVGGITGLIYGSTDTKRAELHNSDYRQGTITVFSGNGGSFLGGAVGSLRASGTITNCSSLQSGFEISKTGTGLSCIGNFAGIFYSGTVENCYAEKDVTVIADTGANGNMFIGGFAGRIDANTSYCYAKGNVSVLGYGHVLAGGFTGAITLGITLSKCYATGNITAINRGGSTNTPYNYSSIGGYIPAIAVGGLVGYCDQADIVIENCYALGDVFADKPVGDGGIFAGGLIGVTNGKTANCFAIGSVVAQRASDKSDKTGSQNIEQAVSAGGLIGRKTGNRDAQNNAVRGERVTATGPGVINMGRIFGVREGNGTISNRAFNDLQFRTSIVYSAGGITPTTPTSSTADSKDGTDAHAGNFRDRSFWGDATGSTGLKFNSNAIWDFSTVEMRGYPVLRSENGQRLGGQQ